MNKINMISIAMEVKPEGRLLLLLTAQPEVILGYFFFIFFFFCAHRNECRGKRSTVYCTTIVTETSIIKMVNTQSRIMIAEEAPDNANEKWVDTKYYQQQQ